VSAADQGWASPVKGSAPSPSSASRGFIFFLIVGWHGLLLQFLFIFLRDGQGLFRRGLLRPVF
jgi:hypothetical protein